MSEADNKYLVFSIGTERYGVPITKVREVIRHERITPVHDTFAYLKGVINLRGKIIPIIDMRTKFGMDEIDYSDRTVFVITDVIGEKEVYNFGVAVDAVHEVVPIADTEIEQLPDVGFRLKSHYLFGVAKVNGQLLMVLNIDRILTTEDIIQIAEVERPLSAAS